MVCSPKKKWKRVPGLINVESLWLMLVYVEGNHENMEVINQERSDTWKIMKLASRKLTKNASSSENLCNPSMS